MKFICHNCGFSAEIPKAIGACTMCGSTNTDAETVTEEIKPEPVTSPAPEKEEATTPAPTPTPSEDLRIKTASLSEEFFTKKPYQEEQEIADLLKEIGAEEQRQPKKPFPVKTLLGTIGAVVVVGGIARAVIFTPTVHPPARPPAISESGAESSPADEVKQEPAPAPETKPESGSVGNSAEASPAPAPEVKPEPAPAPEAKPEPGSVENSAGASPTPAPESKPVPAPTPTPKQKPTPPAKPAPQPKAKTAPQPAGGAFDKLVAEGNQAIAEQRFNDAIHSYKDALKLNPRAGKVHKYLGIAYASMGNAAKACEHYKKYLAMVPDAPDRAQVEQLTADCP